MSGYWPGDTAVQKPGGTPWVCMQLAWKPLVQHFLTIPGGPKDIPNWLPDEARGGIWSQADAELLVAIHDGTPDARGGVIKAWAEEISTSRPTPAGNH